MTLWPQYIQAVSVLYPKTDIGNKSVVDVVLGPQVPLQV